MRDDGFSKMPDAFPRRWLPELSGAETKLIVALIDETAGWQREEAEMDIEDWMRATGLSRPAVIEGLRRGREHGCIGRRRGSSRSAYRYRLLHIANLRELKPRQPPDKQRALPLNVHELSDSKLKKLTASGVKKTDCGSVKKVNSEPPSPNIDLKTHTHTDSKERVCPSEFSKEQRTEYANAQNPKLRKGWIYVSQNGGWDDDIRDYFTAKMRRQQARFENNQNLKPPAETDRASADEIRQMLKHATKKPG